jgi:hypothetical protein
VLLRVRTMKESPGGTERDSKPEYSSRKTSPKVEMMHPYLAAARKMRRQLQEEEALQAALTIVWEEEPDGTAST